MDVFLNLLGAWRNRGELRPARKHFQEMKRNRAPIPWNGSAERSWHAASKERDAAMRILKSYDNRMVGGCNDPRCGGRCGR